MAVRLERVHRKLAELRRGIRGAWALRGTGLVVGGVGVVVVASFLLDYWLELPRVVRGIHLALVGIGLIVAVRNLLLRPLSRPLSEEDLAHVLEAGAPELEDRVSSALDFATRVDDPDEPESRELMRRVLDEAERRVGDVAVGPMIDRRPALRAGLVAAGGVLALLLTIGLAGDAFGIWVQRGVLVGDVDWPRRTTLVLEGFPEDNHLSVTRGDELRIVAVAQGKAPREVTLHYEELNFASPDAEPEVVLRDERKMYPLEQQPERYSFTFRSVSASFRCWVTGGDDQDDRPVYTVRAEVPPRIGDIAATITYPEYTGLAPETLRQPDLELLEGSQVRLSLQANMPLASARMLPSDAAPVDLPVLGDRDRLELTFEVDVDREFRLELVAESGQRNREQDDRFSITRIADDEPSIRMLFPEGQLYRTPNGIVPVKAMVMDDFGLGRIETDIRVNTDAPTTNLVWSDAASADDAGNVREFEAYAPLDLATLGNSGDEADIVAAGDRVHLTVRAFDSGGGIAEADGTSIEIVAPEALERRLAQRQLQLREALSQLRRDQRRTLQLATELAAALDAAPPDARSLERARDLQVDQGRVTNDLRQFRSGIRGVMDAYVLNRLGTPTTGDRLLAMYREAFDVPVSESGAVFPESLYDAVLVEKRAERIYDPEVLGALLDILDLTEQATIDLSPQVYDAARGFVDDDRDPARLAEARRLSVELETLLARIDERMDRWEALNELIALAYQVRDAQDELDDPIDTGSGGGR